MKRASLLQGSSDANSHQPIATGSSPAIVSKAESVHRTNLCIKAVSFLISLVICGWAYGDVGLVIESPSGLMGFLSDVGHASVWISRGCLDDHGDIRYCDEPPGIVVTSTSYSVSPGVAAI